MDQAPSTPHRIPAPWLAGLFVVSFAFSLWGVTVGWQSRKLPGVEFRQAQTAISAHFIQIEDNFSLAYPTPVLGQPWSIPLEFPLYQWTTVVVSNLTGLGLTKAGRLVGIGCFYLCLPALWLLLARWRVAAEHRWVVLALVVAAPFHLFYARAFLIETMALMFALWFWVGFERAVTGRHAGWLALAVVMGVGAGLVKVTTFAVYLLPAGAWALQRLWARRRDGQWKADLAWMGGIVILPLWASVGWVWWADATKALNPMADFLNSQQVSWFTLGTTESRLSPELWAAKWEMVIGGLTAPVVLFGGLVLALLVVRARWREVVGCLLWFALPLAVFPELYARHAYYFMANSVLLFLALGLGLVALLESRVPRLITGFLLVAVLAGQVSGYLARYYPEQSEISPGGDALTQSLRDLTAPDEYLIVAGHDWNSMLPYYARRRAVMFRADVEGDSGRHDAALSRLQDERPGALVIKGPLAPRAALIARAAALGLESTPLYLWEDNAVFLPPERRAQNLRLLEDNHYHGMKLAPGVELPHTRLAGAWFDTAALRVRQRGTFQAMNPPPVRFFSTYGPVFYGAGGKAEFGAHPDTRLVFGLPAGNHTLRTSLTLPPETYQPELSAIEATDGVEVRLLALTEDGGSHVLATKRVNPRESPADRGEVEVTMEFALPTSGEVELHIGPGAAGRYNRDWAIMGPLKIEPR